MISLAVMLEDDDWKRLNKDIREGARTVDALRSGVITSVSEEGQV